MSDTDTATVEVDDSPDPVDAWPHMYDDNFPAGIAGHVEAAGINPDGLVSTTEGVDIGWEGHRQETQPARRHIEQAGTEATQQGIAQVVESSEQRNAPRRPVSEVADWARYDTVPISVTGQVIPLVKRNLDRRRIVITNQGATIVYVGVNPIPGGSGGVALAANGGFREFYHRGGISIVGTAGGSVDYVEEYYA